MSKASVSFALNGRPGVGLVVSRPPQLVHIEPFFAQLLTGLEAELSPRGVGLTLIGGVKEEIEVFHRWWAERRVDGVVVLDMRRDDTRLTALRDLGLPAVVFGARSHLDSIPALRVDDVEPMALVVEHLVERGHRILGRVGGPEALAHSRSRAAAFREVSARLTGAAGVTVASDYTPDSGVGALHRLLRRRRPPTAVVFDNDVMAVAAISECLRTGIRVPEDLAVVAWDDSLMCSLTHPSVSALARDGVGDGARVARMLMAVVDGLTVPDEVMSPQDAGRTRQQRTRARLTVASAVAPRRRAEERGVMLRSFPEHDAPILRLSLSPRAGSRPARRPCRRTAPGLRTHGARPTPCAAGPRPA